MRVEKFNILNPDGQNLSARLDLPTERPPEAYAVFAHCFTCSKDLKAVHNISKALTRAGFGVLRFDFTGLGESEGDFADTTFSTNISDLVAAARHLSTRRGPAKLLIGHSLGGAAVLQAAAELPEVRAVVTIGAPANPSHVTRLLKDSQDQIETRGEALITLEGREFRIKREFVADLARQRMDQTVSGLKRALLVLHAPLDKVVGIENAGHLFKTARHPKSFVSLDQADHLLTRSRDSLYAGALIAAWASRYVFPDQMPDKVPDQAPDQVSGDVPPAPPDESWPVSTRTEKQPYRTAISASGFQMTADEPVALGGGNLGPTPYDFLLAGLGSCTAMTLRMYADRKKWPLASATVSLRHQKVHALDCEDCHTQNGYIDRIEREIALEGPLDKKQHQRLLEIADRCPVHRTLSSEIKIVTQLTTDQQSPKDDPAA